MGYPTIGDTVVYLDLLAQRLGLRLEDCVRDTFNRISEREGFPERINRVPAEGADDDRKDLGHSPNNS